jgi:His-Xaa-Ser system radical SAM maturase HxsB
MKIWPLKFREAWPDQFILADDSGGYFLSDADFIRRYATCELTDCDRDFLAKNGHAYVDEADLGHLAFLYRWSKRQALSKNLQYLIVIPTLRCNLACTYCQVSRAAEGAHGYDWTQDIVDHFFRFLDTLERSSIKIEFQGGEPLLRLDLLIRIREFCRGRFEKAEFVVCTNLQNVTDEAWRFFDADDTFISTSLDADHISHEKNRTKTSVATDQFLRNFKKAMEQFGSERVSALPTIDISSLPDIPEFIDRYEDFGISSIYLRPINFHGFARRSAPVDGKNWIEFHRSFIMHLITRNAQTDRYVEEYYFSQCLKRVLRTGQDGHIDLRNPQLLARDYIVIDYDGSFFPTDEARMLRRVGAIDLSVGSLQTGIDAEAVATLNHNALNTFDPDCLHCPYQAFCGSDIVDDISRYGRTDLPRHQTWFCRRHMALFDLIFELLYSKDESVQRSLAKWAGVSSLPAELLPSHR